MIKPLQNPRGVSLVEFLLNVAVLIFLFALAFPAYIAFREKLVSPNSRVYQHAEFHHDRIPCRVSYG